MKKKGLLLISLYLFAGFLVMTTYSPITTSAATDNTIVIGVVKGQNKFNVTEVNLEKGTTYKVIFVNQDPLAKHNLRIDVNGDVSESNLDDSEDILIGAPNNDDAGLGGPDKMWEGEFTTPDEDTEVIYFCGYTGHYASGMWGTFIIGEGKKGVPGFTLFFSIFALFLTAAAIPRIRKN